MSEKIEFSFVSLKEGCNVRNVATSKSNTTKTLTMHEMNMTVTPPVRQFRLWKEGDTLYIKGEHGTVATPWTNVRTADVKVAAEPAKKVG